jgi:hypothetical protein
MLHGALRGTSDSAPSCYVRCTCGGQHCSTALPRTALQTERLHVNGRVVVALPRKVPARDDCTQGGRRGRQIATAVAMCDASTCMLPWARGDGLLLQDGPHAWPTILWPHH